MTNPTRLTSIAPILAIGLCTFLSNVIANPNLTPGVWTDITPPWLTKGSNTTMIAQGITLDPKNPGTIFWCNTPFTTSQGGLFKSTDGGSNWKRIGHITNPKWNDVDTLDEPLHTRIDPNNSLHMYCGDGVRGATAGFFVSTDGGNNWTEPQSFIDWVASSGTDDNYDVAVDPTDFNHVLQSFHSTFKSGTGGVLESKDGGTTWTPHTIGGAGNSIAFLYEPRLGLGNSNTWLLGQQGGGYWRTSDGGANWTKVQDGGIQHGGGTHFYTKTGVLYASAANGFLRSTDNGQTWKNVSPFNDGTTCVFGDGTFLYTAPCLGNYTPWYTSLETDGQTWTPFNGGTQTFHFGGPFEMALDSIHGIMYSSNWEQGCMAMKIPNYATSAGNTIATSARQARSGSTSRLFLTALSGTATLSNAGTSAQGVEIYDINGRFLSRNASTGDGTVRFNKGLFGHQSVIVRSR